MAKALIFKYLRLYWFPLLMLIFILGDGYVIAVKKSYIYPYNFLSFLLVLAYVGIFHLQKLVYVLAFCTPLAVSLKELGLSKGPDLSIPTEPIMALIMLLYILNSLTTPLTDRKFFAHPVSKLIILQLVWMGVTMLTSTDIVVSLKFLVSRLWFIFSGYIIIPHLFINRSSIYKFVFCYASALAIVILYTSAIHAQYNFNDRAADWVVSPFYNDHTAYGAALAMFIPVIASFLFLRSLPLYARIISVVFLVMFCVAIVLSFARAGWLSLVIVTGIFLTLILKIRFRTLMITFITLGVLIFTFQTEILLVLGRNETDAKGGFENNIESVSNISTDASNLERLNRWMSALRMWREKPVLGFGPGTYMFKYAPYQLSYRMTAISTNFGTNGNAHSEYLGPLSEQGLPGLLIVIALLLMSTALGYRLVYSLQDRDDRILCAGLFLGLMTYFVHGFFNNFLDTDKLSVPFWGFLAALVVFDVYYPKKVFVKGQKEGTTFS